MRLLDLQLRNFRNYEFTDLDFDPGVNLIVGDNAQGKTNLLEAIGYLGSGKSFRAQKNGEICTMRGKKLYPGDSFSFEGLHYLICIHEPQ